MTNKRIEPESAGASRVRTWLLGVVVASLAWLGWLTLAPTFGFPALAPAAMLNRVLFPRADLGSRLGWSALVLGLVLVAILHMVAAARGLFRPGLVSGAVVGVALWLVVGAVVMPLLELAAPPPPPPGAPALTAIQGMPLGTSPETMRATFMMLHLGLLAPVAALIAWVLFGTVLGATASSPGRRERPPSPPANRFRTALLLVASLVSLTVATIAWVAVKPAVPAAIACSSPIQGNTITGTIHGDVEVSAHASVCTIEGTVQGDVSVRGDTVHCDPNAALTAVDVVGGTVEGNITASGNACTMVWLEDGAEVQGDILYAADGNLGFLGTEQGARVGGDVMLEGGLLWATGGSTTNHIEGDLVCRGGEPKEGRGSGDETNWDGYEDDMDGSIGGSYVSC